MWQTRRPGEFELRPATLAAAALVSLAALGTPVQSQTYPARAVRVIVPFAPGGGTDIIARVMAARLTEPLGQQVIVDNRPGGNTIIGAELAARSAPDGYTLLLSSNGTVAINPALFSKLPYDPLKDFVPVALVGVGPNVLVVHPSLPVKSVKELIALAKAQPGALTYASSGSGGAPHLAGELLKSMAGIDMVHVPYKGANPATTALLAGHVQVMFAGLGPAIAHIRTGRLRGLAVASAQRSPSLPALPTMGEYLKGFEASSWFAVFAPAGTPAAVVSRLNGDIVKVMKRQDVQQSLLAQGYEAASSTPEQLAQLLRQDIARWAGVIRHAGITAD